MQKAENNNVRTPPIALLVTQTNRLNVFNKAKPERRVGCLLLELYANDCLVKFRTHLQADCNRDSGSLIPSFPRARLGSLLQRLLQAQDFILYGVFDWRIAGVLSLAESGEK